MMRGTGRSRAGPHRRALGAILAHALITPIAAMSAHALITPIAAMPAHALITPIVSTLIPLEISL